MDNIQDLLSPRQKYMGKRKSIDIESWKTVYKKLGLLFGVFVLSMVLFLFYDMNYEIFDYVIEKRLLKLASMSLVAVAIGLSTLCFQAVTNNRILTPGVLGLDALYQMFQLLAIIFFSHIGFVTMNAYVNFFMSAALMTLFSLGLYRWVFSRARSIFLIVLVGIVMGTFFTSINGMLQIIISPDVYNMVLGKLFANFNSVASELVGLSAVIILSTGFILFRKRYVLDVIALGKSHSINLGLSYYKEVMKCLVMIFLLVSVSTALVGPITFLGFFSVNIAKNYMDHHQHKYLMLATCLVSMTVVYVGQFMVEHLFDFGLPISVLISLVGGSYFIFMLLKENRR